MKKKKKKNEGVRQSVPNWKTVQAIFAVKPVWGNPHWLDQIHRSF
jgi:hypothetical protein